MISNLCPSAISDQCKDLLSSLIELVTWHARENIYVYVCAYIRNNILVLVQSRPRFWIYTVRPHLTGSFLLRNSFTFFLKDQRKILYFSFNNNS